MTGPLCASHPFPDLWFQEDPLSVAAAKAVCAICPVRAACEEAGVTEPFGTWGGVSAAERFSLMLDGIPDQPAHVPSRAHYVEGCREPECRAANTAWTAKWRHRERPATQARSVGCEQLSLALEATT